MLGLDHCTPAVPAMGFLTFIKRNILLELRAGLASQVFKIKVAS